MLKRYFLSNMLVMVLLNLLVKPIWIFLIDRNVQLTVGHDEYGLYSALLSLSIIFGIVLDFGMTNFNNRNIAKDHQQIVYSLPNMMAAKALFLLAYFSLLITTALLLNYSGRAIYLLVLLGGIQFLNSFLQFLRSNVSANHDFKIDSILSVFDKLLMIIVCGYLLYTFRTTGSFQLEWYLYAQLGAYIVTSLIALIIISKRYTKIHFQHLSFKEMKGLILQSLPYALLILLMGIYMRSDSLLLERLEGPTVSSIYAEAYRILDALNMIGFLFAGILLPMFTRLIGKNIPINEIVKTSANIIISMALCFLAFSFFYNQEIMHLLDKNAVAELPTIYLIVIASFPAFCIMYIYSTLLTANGNLKLLITFAFVGCLLSIGLNLVLIPIWHAIGAGISALVVQYVVATLCVIACHKEFKFSIDFKWLSKFSILFLVFICLNALFHSLKTPLLLSVVCNLFAFIGLVYLIKLWDKNTILSYIKQYKSGNERY